ncbi:MAG TPA: heavy-metal-associated domain-containing protein [Chitinophagaceae bacterium]|jgi:copper chaperone CopZ|nr:heavy-metal-associated domain-containing protein [Chitinophagaceae bacterium]
MKQIFSILLVLFLTVSAKAQITSVSLQASGLTCSMCSKAVKLALEEVSFVDKVQVDIKNQQYNLSFKKDNEIDFDALSKAVEDAGFSVAKLKVVANVDNIQLEKDKHIKIGDQYFHFLNAKAQRLQGSTAFSIVDKSFLSAKDFKRQSSLTKMPCMLTGRAEACCTKDGVKEQTRVYHAII